MKTLLLLLAFALAVPAARAWDGCGHKTVAAIALKQLTPEAKARIDAIFAGDLRRRTDLLDCATWPDDIKRGLRNATPFKAPLDKPWHYINLPYDAPASALDPILNRPGVSVAPSKPSSGNVVTAIRYFTRYLESGKGTATEQADALSWLVHLIGDVHQPLHTLTVHNPLPNYTPPRDARGHSADAGGNGFLLRGTYAPNLHAYWDDILDPGQPASAREPLRIALLAATLDTRPNRPSRTDLTSLEPALWALESYTTRQFIYSPPLASGTTHTIPTTYAQTARKLANKRLTWAGYRLAKVLNGVMGKRS